VGGAQAPGAPLEGVVDMEAAWGAIPERVYLSAVAYTTNDGGFLISSLQAPAPAQADKHLQANEFYEFAIQPPVNQTAGFLVK